MAARAGSAREPAAHRMDKEDQHRLTALEGLASLSLDALSSVAYGPEAIVIVLGAAGAAGLGYTLPVTIAIVVLLAVLVVSYRQVIAAFPGGGGAYAVARRHLGDRASLLAAASLIVDYTLNAAVGVSAGVAALTSAYPVLYGARVWLCLGVLAVITGVNLWGVAESARLFILPTVVFIASMAAVIIGGLLRSQPVVPVIHNVPQATEAVGALLLMKAFASGCSALTGVEAVANAVPEFRVPRARRAQHTEVTLGVVLGLMLIGLSVLIEKFGVTASSTTTVLAQLAGAAVGHNAAFYVIQLSTTVLLALAANTSFGGMPVLASLLAADNFLPHAFGLRAERQVRRVGVTVLAGAAAALLIAVGGDTQALVPLFAIGVFIGFTLSQVGMVRHWHSEGGRGWTGRALVNGFGAVLTFAAIGIELISKFTEGAWLIVLIIPFLVLVFSRIRASYDRIGALLEIGKLPPPPHPGRSLVLVPIADLNRLTQEALSAALSLGDEVVAVHVCYSDPEDVKAEEELRARWNSWQLEIPLITLRSPHRSLAWPMVGYLRGLEAADPNRRLVVLIPEIQPSRPWQELLHNHRGAVLARAIQRGTVNVVICRLRFQLANWETPVTEGHR